MLHFAVQTLPLETFERKFPESKFTHMYACRKMSFLRRVSHVAWVLSAVRINQPYVVREVDRHEFYFTHKLA